MRLILPLALILAVACSSPPPAAQRAALDDAPDMAAPADLAPPADMTYVCPEGAVCATEPDGGVCDPSPGHWQTSCGPGLICSIDGTFCGPACGTSANDVCVPNVEVCTQHGTGTFDCFPACHNAAGAIVYRTGGNCEARGLELDAVTGRCYVPCFIDECVDLGVDYCGPPIDGAALTPAGARARERMLRVQAARQLRRNVAR
jgi:hypothetical protein